MTSTRDNECEKGITNGKKGKFSYGMDNTQN